MNTKRYLRYALLAVCAGAGIFLLATVCFLGLGNWLLSGDDALEPSDAIVVLAGEPSRAFYAADLYAQGYAPLVYISRPVRLPSFVMLDRLGVDFPRAEEIDRQVLLKKGVPEQAVRFFGQASLSTAEEARELRALFCASPTRLIMVTSAYHRRRTRIVMRDALAGCAYRVVATPYERFPSLWWRSQDSARTVMMELIKLLFYRFGGRYYGGKE